MRKLIFATLLLMLAVAVTFTACKKDEPRNDPQAVDVQFDVSLTGFDLKSTNDVPECNDFPLSYVTFELTPSVGAAVTHKSPILYVEGKMLTQVVKLDPDTYGLTNFVVWYDNSTPNDDSDDLPVRAAPKPNSMYSSFMLHPLDIEFTLDAFFKDYVEVDVLCYEASYWTEFGFEWFEFHDVTIEKLCFFGDVCTGKPSEWEGTDNLYASQANGVQMDMPAIFEIRVTGGVKDTVFSNASYYGEGACLEVWWADHADQVDTHTFELWVLLPTAGAFDYVLIGTYTAIDDIFSEDLGDDGVFDFTIGNCNIDGADAQYSAWMHLPHSITANIQNPGGESYWNFTITETSPANATGWPYVTYAAWCGDGETTIGEGTQTFYPFSSLFPGSWPAHNPDLTGVKMKVINYLFNHLPDYSIPYVGMSSTQQNTVQDVIWAILHGGSSSQMRTDAETFIGDNPLWNPMPGEYAGVLMFRNNGGNYRSQLLFVQVDP